MNIFFLHEDAVIAATMQCDKHVPKMLLETAQMLSTAHRVLDGTKIQRPSKSGKRMVWYWEHPDPQLDEVLYTPTHVNHPSSVWIRENSENYKWAFTHFVGLCVEFRFRFRKAHLSETKLRRPLANLPKNIPPSVERSPIALAIDDKFKGPDPISSYQKFYQAKQERMTMEWNRGTHKPDWFERIEQ